MPRRFYGLEAELHEAGFSTRTITAIVYGAGIKSLDELKSTPWGTGNPGDNGLAWKLATTGNFGKKGLAEVEAFREGRDVRSARPPGPASLTIPMESKMLAELDAFIARQPKPTTRPEAIREFVAAALRLMKDER